MKSKIRLVALGTLIAAQVWLFAAPAPAADGGGAGCLIWVWIDGWRCVFP